MNEKDNEILIEEELKEFDLHLKADKRCILSAKFGEGKSYFLTKFMEMKSDDYIFIPIYPLNYQVSDNKDIFEYIKRDILVRLLCTKGVVIDNIEEKALSSFFSFLKTNKKNVFSFLVDILPQVNIGVPGCNLDIDAKNIKKSIDALNKKFETHKKTEQDIVNNFIESFSEKGSIYECDPISQLITTILKGHLISEVGKTKKEVVLIVEDLDRIDPAHLFRILNIFSAHFEWSGSMDRFVTENKFGFHKIIIVSDYSNIQNIYIHLYGPRTDFGGYIGKFLTSKPFHFSLRESRLNFITNYIDRRMDKYPIIKKQLTLEISKLNIRVRDLVNKLQTPIIPKKWIQTLIDNTSVYHYENDLAYFINLCERFGVDPQKTITADAKEQLELVGIGWCSIFEVYEDFYTIPIPIRGYQGSTNLIFTGFDYKIDDKKRVVEFRFNENIEACIIDRYTSFYHDGRNIDVSLLMAYVNKIIKEYNTHTQINVLN